MNTFSQMHYESRVKTRLNSLNLGSILQKINQKGITGSSEYNFKSLEMTYFLSHKWQRVTTFVSPCTNDQQMIYFSQGYFTQTATV